MKTQIMTQLQSRKQEKVLLAAFTLTFILSTLLLATAPVRASETSYDYSTQSLRVGVWVDGLDEGDVLDRGEEMAVGFQTNEDSYAVVYRINTEGLVTVLWPRSRLDDGFVFGGHEYFVPVTGSRRLAASSQSGEGFIEAIVSRYPFDLRDLAVDFHHEFEAEPEGFYISGDPFLAMNEVNFAVTGMEDSGDFVVTNYLSYYVHEVVDHPRYLCNQCHMDDDLAMDPYRDECAIDITHDYSWGNDWYNDYGYYPVYHNPVYVYIDPWTFRPWVNFWYDPFYVCAYRPGYSWNYPVYTWNDSPYYGKYGNRVKSGRGLYRPTAGQAGRRQPKDFTQVTRQVARGGPTERERDSMRQKQPVVRPGGGSGRGGTSVRPNDNPIVVRGEKPMVRPRPTIEKPVRGTSRGGLQIRNLTSRKPRTGSGSSVSVRPVRSEIQTTPVVRPGRGGSVGGTSTLPGLDNITVRGTGSSRSGSSNVKPSSGANADRRIKPVEPRKKGTRIWNSGSGTQNNGRNTGRSVEPRRNTRSGSSSGSAVKPRNNSSSSGSRKGSSATVKPKSNSRSSSGSKSRSSGSTVKSKSSSGSKSSSSKSSSSRSSGGSSGKSRSSGSSKSGGGSSKSSRSGGSSTRR